MNREPAATPERLYQRQERTLVAIDLARLIKAQVHPGDVADTESLREQVMEGTAAVPGTDLQKRGTKLAARQGYTALEEIARLRQGEVCTVVADPLAERRGRDFSPRQEKLWDFRTFRRWNTG